MTTFHIAHSMDFKTVQQTLVHADLRIIFISVSLIKTAQDR